MFINTDKIQVLTNMFCFYRWRRWWSQMTNWNWMKL